jgi:hypothetical protein
MDGYLRRRFAAHQSRRDSRSPKARVGCEALESRELLSRGMGLDAVGGLGMGRRGGFQMAELGSFGGGGAGAMFGSGDLGVGGGMKSPIFLLTASLLNTGSGSTTKLTRSELSSSAVQSAYQTLESDLNNDVTVGSDPTHASVGQLEDDLESIRKGKLTGSAATTAIQNDEAAILTSMGLTSTQVSQIQSDLQAVQTAIQSASGSSSGTSTTLSNGSTTTSGTSSTTTSGASSTSTSGTSSTSTSGTSSTSAVQSALQTLQTALNDDTPVDSQPTHASIGQVEDDLDAISKGTLTGSQAVTQVQTDTAAVLTSEGMTSSEVTQIQSDQAALWSAIQANTSQSSNSTSSSSSSTSSSSSSTPAPNSIAGVEATMQSVQQYLIGLTGFGGLQTAGGGGFGGSGGGGPIMIGSGGASGINPGGPMMVSTGGAIGGGSGGPIMVGSGSLSVQNVGGFGSGYGGW